MRTNNGTIQLRSALDEYEEWVPQPDIARLLRYALGKSLCQEVDANPGWSASGGVESYEAEHMCDLLSVGDFPATYVGGGQSANWLVAIARDWLDRQEHADRESVKRTPWDPDHERRVWVSKSILAAWLWSVSAFVDDPRTQRDGDLPFQAVPWGLAAVLARRFLGLKGAREAAELLSGEAQRSALAFRDREEGGRWVFLRTTGDGSAGLLDLLEKLCGAELAEVAETEAAKPAPLPMVADSERVRLRHTELRRDDPEYRQILQTRNFAPTAAEYLLSVLCEEGVEIKLSNKSFVSLVREFNEIINQYFEARSKMAKSEEAWKAVKKTDKRTLGADARKLGIRHDISDAVKEVVEQIWKNEENVRNG